MILKITYTDGTVETVQRVDDYHIRDGVLSAFRQGMYRVNLGNWPLVNVRMWVTDERQ